MSKMSMFIHTVLILIPYSFKTTKTETVLDCQGSLSGISLWSIIPMVIVLEKILPDGHKNFETSCSKFLFKLKTLSY